MSEDDIEEVVTLNIILHSVMVIVITISLPSCLQDQTTVCIFFSSPHLPCPTVVDICFQLVCIYL